jgi:hypothetical protein
MPEPEPDVGGRRPEYLVDGSLIEAKTYCLGRKIDPIARLKFEICERLNSRSELIDLRVRGTLTQNHVRPLIKGLSRASLSVGSFVEVEHRGVAVSFRVASADSNLLNGSSITAFRRAVTVDECSLVFRRWDGVGD